MNTASPKKEVWLSKLYHCITLKSSECNCYKTATDSRTPNVGMVMRPNWPRRIVRPALSFHQHLIDFGYRPNWAQGMGLWNNLTWVDLQNQGIQISAGRALDDFTPSTGYHWGFAFPTLEAALEHLEQYLILNVCTCHARYDARNDNWLTRLFESQNRQWHTQNLTVKKRLTDLLP
jgi:hypothetical protein